MSRAPDLRCPVCRARFRGTRECSRCGADLEPLMSLAVRGYLLRHAALRAFERNDFARARELVRAAQRIHDTSEGRRLGLLAQWLDHGAGVTSSSSR